MADATIVLCNEIGQWVTYQSDEHGFHNPRELYGRKQKTLQIAALGDSFTQGWCSDSEKGIVGLIRNTYPDTLNLGMSRNGPLLELASLREYAAPLKPEITLWFYYEGNDLKELIAETQDKILQRYLSERDFSQKLISRREEIQTLLQQYSTARLHEISHSEQTSSFADILWLYRKHSVFKFIMLSRLTGRLHLFPSPVEANRIADLSLFRQVLHHAHEEIKTWQGKLYFVYLCQKSRLSHLGKPNPYRHQVLDIVQDLAIHLIDGCKIFRNETNPLSLYQGHFTEKGNALIAEAIVNTLSAPESSR